MNKKSLQGFTLIELLIVIVIIGILSTLALPQYRLATEKSKIEAVLPIMRKIREAQMLYFMEYREPTCDLQKLNLKLDVVTEKKSAIQHECIFHVGGFQFVISLNKRDGEAFIPYLKNLDCFIEQKEYRDQKYKK
jgi:prepilin-type N-terminal cleavage/methylation domain-containing protein